MRFGRTKKYNKKNNKNNKKTRKHYKKYKGGVNEYLDNNFVRCYEENLTKVMRAIQQFSGTHSINRENANQFINEQLTETRKQAARDLIDNTVYITLQETSLIVEQLIIRLYSNPEYNLNESETIYFYSGMPSKSFYFLSILALYYIRKNGFKEPTHFIKDFKSSEIFKEIGYAPLIILDDVSYSGSQLSKMLNSIYFELVIKNKQKEPNIFILLTGLNDFSKERLTKVPTKISRGLELAFTASPFKLIFLPDRLYKPLINIIGIERYFYVNIFFSICTPGAPIISTYLDHKIADTVSTYKKALMYGPIIPSNLNLTQIFGIVDDSLFYDFLRENDRDISNLLNDFNSANGTAFTTSNLEYLNEFVVNKLMKSEEEIIDKQSMPYIKFRPFINGCKDNKQLIDNINDPEIINLDYLLFMAPDDCIKGPCKSINNTMYSTLQEIVENAQMSKQKAVEISDRINNLSCPESWYKSGDFQMTCL
jgi:hypothetical protein